MKRMLTRIGCVLVGMAVFAPAPAQQATGTLFSGCGSLDAERRLELPFVAPLAAGHTVIVAVAAAPVMTSGLRLTDTRGNLYAPLSARRTRTDATSVLILATRVPSKLLAGDTLRLQLDTVAGATEICAIGIGYSDLLWETYALRASATRRGDDTAPVASAVSPPIDHARLAAFSFASSPGPLAAGPGVSLSNLHCAASGAVCLAFAHAEGGPGSSAANDISLAATHAAQWQAAAAILPRRILFSDGFESP